MSANAVPVSMVTLDDNDDNFTPAGASTAPNEV